MPWPRVANGASRAPTVETRSNVEGENELGCITTDGTPAAARRSYSVGRGMKTRGSRPAAISVSGRSSPAYWKRSGVTTASSAGS